MSSYTARTFDPVAFISGSAPKALLDCQQYPYLHNENGRGWQLSSPDGTLIELSPDAPELDAGIRYEGIEHRQREVKRADGSAYAITEFDFHRHEVEYEALPATRVNAQAFGMTLLKNGECLPFDFPNLDMTEYCYGKWAGHQSPYLGPERMLELLSFNPTDLEYHNFPHVFFSNDALPLVISVARWRPYVGEIALADLWIAPGDALVLPPKVKPAMPPPGTP